MQRKQIVVILVCVVVIVAALVWTLKRRGARTSAPQGVLATKGTYFCGACGAEVTLTLKEWGKLEMDPKTSYRKCPKCGAMALSTPIRCAMCGAKIIGPPVPQSKTTGNEDENPDEPGELSGEIPGVVTYYKCPKCGKNALAQRRPR